MLPLFRGAFVSRGFCPGVFCLEGLLSRRAFVQRAFVQRAFVSRGLCLVGLLSRGLFSRGLLSRGAFVQGAFVSRGFLRGFCLKGRLSRGAFVPRGFCQTLYANAIRIRIRIKLDNESSSTYYQEICKSSIGEFDLKSLTTHERKRNFGQKGFSFSFLYELKYFSCQSIS